MAEKPSRPDRHGHGETIVKRGSRKHHDEGHGGAWKVAFADFCLALLCLFLVLWLMAAREQDKLQEVRREPGGSVMNEGQGRMTDTLGGPRGSMIDSLPMPRFGDATSGARAPKGGASAPTEGTAVATTVTKTRYESQTDLQALAQVLEKLSLDAGLSANLQAVITAYGLRVMLHDTDKQGMFERGSSVPSERFTRLLRKMGPLFAQMQNQMLIVGHTDSAQYADRSLAGYSNWTLSSNRAMAARIQLMAGGMPSTGFLQVVGMADRAPLDSSDATASVNRRIEMLILTSGQANTIAAMFGQPDKVQLLIEGADSAMPDHTALQALRTQIIQAKGSMATAN